MKKILLGLTVLTSSIFAAMVNPDEEPVDNTNVFSTIGKLVVTGTIEYTAPTVKYAVFAGMPGNDQGGEEQANFGKIVFESYSKAATFEGSPSLRRVIYIRKVGTSGMEALGRNYKVSIGGDAYNDSLAFEGGTSQEIEFFRIYSDTALSQVFESPTFTVQDGKIYHGTSATPDKLMDSATLLEVSSTQEGELTMKLIENPNPSGSAITATEIRDFTNALNLGQSNLSFQTPIYIRVGA